jgi:starch phosphorylase
MRGTQYVLEVQPELPARLARLNEIANNLWYSWDRPTRTLFARLHPRLWDAVGHNPKAFLKRVDERRLREAADDPVYLGNLNRVLSNYDTYHNEPLRQNGSEWLRQGDLVAYFCAEFGLHESFPIYSGGLGILAGDHCKAASDMALPFVAVGLLYKQGYFIQTIDLEGNQHATHFDSDFDDMPVSPVLGTDGSDVRIEVELPGRRVVCKVWKSRCGLVNLYLLDTDLDENAAPDRDIAHRLYGGDRSMRIEQEIILGVGGVRALRALGIKPTVWHINEGHAAFQILERIRHKVSSLGLDFATALESVAANTVFTTHTAVPAGHDHFSDDMMLRYFETFYPDMKVAREEFLGLGRNPNGHDFNMTTLAIRGSRYHNGVSRIHGEVSSKMLAMLWPQIEAEENPIDYVTNGVHVPSFLTQEWQEVFDRYLGFEWTHRLRNEQFWEAISSIPDHVFWSVRQSLKAQMLLLVRHRITTQHYRNNGSEAHLERLLRFADPSNTNVLTLGFARRFATYKRATLLFEDLGWLRQILLDADRPVLVLFAGKAHPADVPGQDLIRRIAEIARMPEFEGRLLLVEDYDLRLARRLVSGVDVWLNNPIYPLEASGTSGMKAGINGALNLSVLDGWWEEGYDGKNGWAIKPASPLLDEYRRNREEARTLYEILQDQVIPLYYDRNPLGFSPGWIKMAKHSMATLMPRFNATRMVGQYVSKFYLPASKQWRRIVEGDFEPARHIAVWKRKIGAHWGGVRIRRLDTGPRAIRFGEAVRCEVAVQLNGLAPEDVRVEMLIGRQRKRDKLKEYRRHAFEFVGVTTEQGEHVFALEITPDMCGKLEYQVRAYPHHERLTHPFETGLMVWL